MIVFRDEARVDGGVSCRRTFWVSKPRLTRRHLERTALAVVFAMASIAALLVGGEAGATDVTSSKAAADAAAPIEEEPETEPKRNPWVDGPDAATDDGSLIKTSAPPRRPNATVEIPIAPPPVPDEGLPIFIMHAAPLRPTRSVTVLDRQALARYGPLNLEQALTQVVGLEHLRTAPQFTLLGSRGLSADSVDIMIDGVPALMPSIFPNRSVFSDVALLDVASVTVHHGPQAILGAARGIGGVVNLSTFDPPRELGGSLPLRGRLVGGLGGPEALKTVQLRAEGGVGRVRGTVSGSVVDTDDLHLGRGLATLSASGAQGGTLGARGDVAINNHFRVFAALQTARQTRMPLPNACFVNQNRNATDCARVFDVGRDALLAGGEGSLPFPVLGATLSIDARSHVQRVLNHRDRFGSSLTFVERREDEATRAGALGSVRLQWPSFGPLAAFLVAGRPSLTLGAEVRRDRIHSQAFIRSTRGADADPGGVGVERPDRRTSIHRTRAGFEAALATFALQGPVVDAHAKFRVAHENASIPPTVDGRLRLPSEINSISYTADVAARLFLTSEWSFFASGHALRTGPQIDALTQGPSINERALVLPAEVDTSTTSTGGEIGARVLLSWLTLDVVTYAYNASGALRGLPLDDTLRIQRAAPRWGAGLEVRGDWRTGLDGLTAHGTLAAPVVDEGELTQDGGLVLPFVAMTPADAVTGPYGHLALRYAPSANWFSGFVRSRFVAPHVRLGAEERVNPRFCDAQDVPLSGSVVPCVGAPGHIGLDVGGRFAPTDAFAIDAVGENLLDLPFAPRTGALPWGGLGVRIKLTVNL